MTSEQQALNPGGGCGLGWHRDRLLPARRAYRKDVTLEDDGDLAADAFDIAFEGRLTPTTTN